MNKVLKTIMALFLPITVLGCNKETVNSKLLNCKVGNTSEIKFGSLFLSEKSKIEILFSLKESKHRLFSFNIKDQTTNNEIVCKNDISYIHNHLDSFYFLSKNELFLYKESEIELIDSNVIDIKGHPDGVIYKKDNFVISHSIKSKIEIIKDYNIITTSNPAPLLWRYTDNKLELLNLATDKINTFTINSQVNDVMIPSWESSHVLVNNKISKIWYDNDNSSFMDSPYSIDFNLSEGIITKVGLINITSGNIYHLGITNLKLVDNISKNPINKLEEDTGGNIYFSDKKNNFVRFSDGDIFSLGTNRLFEEVSTYENHTESILKWPRPYASAVSLNNDTGCIDCNREETIRGNLENLGLRIDYEVVNKVFEDEPNKQQTLLDITSRGHGYYGHGETHDNHDSMSYFEALDSFKNNMTYMNSFGLNPVLLAYPGGYGRNKSTQEALRDAGFYLGRSFNQASFPYKEQFIYKSKSDLKNIWFLPILRFENYNSTGCSYCIDTEGELDKYLTDNRQFGSWLIFVFHAIGYEEGWGYTTQSFFEHTIKTLAQSSDIWVAPTQEVAKQILQHKYTSLYIRGAEEFQDSGLPPTFDRKLESK